MSRRTTLEERLQIIRLTDRGLTDRQVGAQTGWSVSTIRKWRRRYQRGGRAGLAGVMGRPRQGPLGSFSQAVRDQVAHLRQQHPGWGPLTLHLELQHRSLGDPVPAPASIGRYLRAQGLSRRYKRRSPLPATKPPVATRVHQLWSMDARGHSQVPDLGLIILINITDCASRLRVQSYPVQAGHRRLTHNPDTADYQTALRLAFADWGLPERIQVDRAAVFYDNRARSAFPTRLHLWLLALGVGLCFARPRQPTDQAIVERSHQLWAQQCLHGQTYSAWSQLYDTLQQRRDFLNQVFPSASLNHQPPLVAFPQARHSGRPYRPEYEPELLNPERIWGYLTPGRWFRRVSQIGVITIGGQQYYLDYTLAGQQVELTFDPDQLAFRCHNEAGDLIARKPIQGISVETLMGDLPIHLPAFQLHLPFDWKALRVLRLFETMVA